MKKSVVEHKYVDGEWSKLPRTSSVAGQPGGRLRDLSRSTLLELHGRDLIKIASIRKPGAKKALRLVWLPSLDAYLESLIK